MSGANGQVSVLPFDAAEFYDQFSAEWEEDRGEHLHVGFYNVPSPPDNRLDHKAATIRLIEGTAKFATISEKDEHRSIELEAFHAKDHNRVAFQVDDTLDQHFPDGHFYLVWAMESGEHMPDKEKFMQELVRMAAPGGIIIITTCCNRDLLKGETSLQQTEQELLDKLSGACSLPAWCSTADYVRMAQAFSLQNIKTTNWSENVVPFFSSFVNYKLTWVFLEAAFKTMQGASPVHLWLDGFKQELVKYALITAQKPT